MELLETSVLQIKHTQVNEANIPLGITYGLPQWFLFFYWTEIQVEIW